MLKLLVDNRAIMGLTLSQIGLMVATAILITSVFSFIYFNNWDRQAEIHNIAESFTTIVQGKDTKFYENTTVFWFPDTSFYLNISVSTEYITINSKGKLGSDLSVKNRFLINPWPKNHTGNWTNGNSLHNWLKSIYGQLGDENNPVTVTARKHVNNERNIENLSLASKPIFINLEKPVYIEKVIIFYDVDSPMDNIWDEKQSFILIYQ